ncbi:hypothetical protein QTO30_16740 [Yoonia sp. GPGPB17]|uniref:hypothetical protein n=1 Tax=Yoonia sp. GPGPB17 TaxID=3026147 RepID=UPI0030BB0FF4
MTNSPEKNSLAIWKWIKDHSAPLSTMGTLFAAIFAAFASLSASNSASIAKEQLINADRAEFRASVSQRASICSESAAQYNELAFAYGPVNLNVLRSEYGLNEELAKTAGIPFSVFSEQPDQPNQLLSSFAQKSRAVSRALQLCLIHHSEKGALAQCVDAINQETSYWIYTDEAPGQIDPSTPDNLIC